MNSPHLQPKTSAVEHTDCLDVVAVKGGVVVLVKLVVLFAETLEVTIKKSKDTKLSLDILTTNQFK